MGLRFPLILFLSIFIASSSYSQDLSGFLERSDSIRSVYAVEKVYLHLDKPYYAAGQTIWLKAYIVDGANRPSMLSKIIYVELIDENNRVCKTLKLPIAAGLASGDIALADTLSEGNYRVRAYTRWMRNFGEDGFYDQLIAIGNSFSNDILSRVSYTYSKKASGADHIEAVISYSTSDGSALQSKEVSYEVQLSGKDVLKGKESTDKEGKLKTSFESKGETSQTGWINTSFTYNDRLVSRRIPVKSTRSEVSVQFFPEGGRLVDSIPSKIAFKATGSNGLGVNVSGYVIDDQQARVAEFKTEHAGMGTFMLSPYGQNYTAIIHLPEGEKRIPLPKAEQQGYVLALLKEDKDKLYIRITASKVTQRLNPGKELSIVAQSGAETHVVSKFRLSRQFIDVAFPKQALPTGITRLTLFEDNIPKSERLTFIHQDQLDLKLTTDKGEYGPREKVKMELTAKDKESQAVTGSFSVSVTDMSRVPVNEEAEHTILSDLLIRSELRGYIENPSYYFIDSTRIRKFHLENLLLTQGWRRLSWKEIENEASLPKISFQPEQSMEISGVVSLRGNPAEGVRVSLFTPDGGVYLDTSSNALGRFNFDKLVFADSTRFVIQGRTTNERGNVRIRLDGIAPQQVSLQGSYADFEENVNSTMLPYLKDSKEELSELIKQGLLTRNNLLEEVVVKARSDPNFVENSSNLSTTGADYVIRADRIQGYTNLGQALQGKIPGIQINFDPTGASKDGTTATLLRNRDKMQLFVDGADWGNDLNFVNVNDIATVEILRGGGTAALYGQKASGGIIIVTTKTFAGIPAETVGEAQGLIQYRPRGYTIAREFYSPNYDVPESKKDFEDLRTTVYWNPDLFSEKGKNPAFEFFTADRPGTYRAVVEGLDHRGKLGRSVYTFKVTEKKK